MATRQQPQQPQRRRRSRQGSSSAATMLPKWTSVLCWMALVSLATHPIGCHAQSEEKTEDLVRVILNFNTAEEQLGFERSVGLIEEEEDEASSNTTEPVPPPPLWLGRSPSFRTGRRPMTKRLNAAANQAYHYHHGTALALTLPRSDLGDLEHDPRISGVEVDDRIELYQQGGGGGGKSPFREEVVPYGISAVQGDSDEIPVPAASSSSSNSGGACQDPNAFRVCVVDSGLLEAHDDIPYSMAEGNVVGRTFGLNPSKDWFNPSAASSHGTHVAGTIVAQGGNNKGVVGVVGDNSNQCLMIARTFDEEGVTSSSFIIQAVEWCADNGAKIVNLSLGSSNGISRANANVYRRLYEEEDVLIVAAAGNDGSSQLAYPASLDEVISVGAVDRDNRKARFSQFNNQVDLVAPGVNILSTVSANGLMLSTRANPIKASIMTFSPGLRPQYIGRDLELVDCGDGTSTCRNAQGRVCVMERGEVFFSEKALACQNGGGVVALVYNNDDGSFLGTLGDENSGVDIPVYAVPREDGLELLEEIDDDATLVVRQAAPDYDVLDGTSMATPHVTGVAAKIWSARPQCTNQQIREAMEESALDLGSSGKDNNFGHGLVQAEDALDYIVQEFDPPCGGIVVEQQEEEVEDNSAIFEEVLQGATEDLATEVVGGRECRANQAICSDASECCSNRCVAATVGGTPMCRSVPNAGRQPIGGGNRGGSAGFRNTGNGARRAAAAESSSSPARIRGGASANKPNEEDWISSLPEQGYQLL